MKINHWLWALWGTMIIAMLLKWKIEPYMVIALIVLPLLIVLMELHEEISLLKEEAKHQRKFVMDRYNILSEKLNDLSGNLEKKIVVDFSEFAKENPPAARVIREKKKKRRPPEGSSYRASVDLTSEKAPNGQSEKAEKKNDKDIPESEDKPKA